MNISRGRLVALAIALVVGAWLGYASREALTSGGIAAIGGIGGILIAALLVLVCLFVAAVSHFQPDGRGGRGARTALAAALLVGVGFGGGWIGSLALGGAQPVALVASGTAGLSLDGLAGYAGQGGTASECRSEVGSESVVWLEANVGTVGVDAVYASLAMDPRDPGVQPAVVVWIAPVVKGPDAAPQWRGAATVVDGAVGDRAGRATFASLSLDVNETGVEPVGWPATLAGSLTWTCDEWRR